MHFFLQFLLCILFCFAPNELQTFFMDTQYIFNKVLKSCMPFIMAGIQITEVIKRYSLNAFFLNFTIPFMVMHVFF